jgi:hypothetical protein
MTNNQLFFALVTVIFAVAALMRWYIDAKIDPISDNVRRLIDYMILHEGKIATLEERTERIQIR